MATSYGRYRRSGRAAGRTALALGTALSAALNGRLAIEQRTYQGMHTRVAQIAAAAYKDGTLDYTTSLLAARVP